MKKASILALTGCLTLLCACGSDDENNNSNSGVNNEANNENNAANNTTNTGENNTSVDGLAAQRLGANLFGPVFSALQLNANKNAPNSGGPFDCADISTTVAYGQATFDYSEGSTTSIYEVAVLLDGCLSVHSGTNAAFTFATQDASGDGLPETFLLNGTLDAVSFGDDGLPLANDVYDPSLEPTCSNVVFDKVLIETIGVRADGMGFSNETVPHNPDGYSEGVITADCGTQKLRCQLGVGNAPIGLINLDAVASSKGVESICVFE